MPLSKRKGKKAFQENMRTEVDAKKAEGYSPKKSAQIAAAIAYKTEREAKK